jgi:hypothetical protein
MPEHHFNAKSKKDVLGVLDVEVITLGGSNSMQFNYSICLWQPLQRHHRPNYYMPYIISNYSAPALEYNPVRDPLFPDKSALQCTVSPACPRSYVISSNITDQADIYNSSTHKPTPKPKYRMSGTFQALLNEHSFMPRGQLQESQQCISNRPLDR